MHHLLKYFVWFKHCIHPVWKVLLNVDCFFPVGGATWVQLRALLGWESLIFSRSSNCASSAPASKPLKESSEEADFDLSWFRAAQRKYQTRKNNAVSWGIMGRHGPPNPMQLGHWTALCSRCHYMPARCRLHHQKRPKANHLWQGWEVMGANQMRGFHNSEEAKSEK